ncbi:MAG: hypothetical protein [Caudoviricetes sp.]|nr:MAG: hypothetical protein [Caudoviricetes sp.]
MQGTQSIEKFSKKPKQVLVDGTDHQPALKRSKKLNKPQRGGGVKGEFRNAKGDSLVDQEKYIDYKGY